MFFLKKLYLPPCWIVQKRWSAETATQRYIRCIVSLRSGVSQTNKTFCVAQVYFFRSTPPIYSYYGCRNMSRLDVVYGGMAPQPPTVLLLPLHAQTKMETFKTLTGTILCEPFWQQVSQHILARKIQLLFNSIATNQEERFLLRHTSVCLCVIRAFLLFCFCSTGSTISNNPNVRRTISIDLFFPFFLDV